MSSPVEREAKPRIPTHFYWIVALIALKQILLVMMVDIGFTRVGPRILSILVASYALALCAAAPAALARGRRQAAILLGVGTLLTMIAYGHVLYYRQYQILPTAASLRYFGQLVTVRGSVASLARPTDLWIVIDLIALALFAALPSLGRRLEPLRLRQAAGQAVLGIVLLSSVMLPFSNRAHRPWRGAVHLAGNLNFIGYHYHHLLKSWLQRVTSPTITPELRETALDRVAAAAEAPVTDYFGAAEGLNLIVIQFESLQGFAFGLETPDGPVTPNLEKLARESIVFPEFYHQAAAGNTSDAQFASNCSILPPGNRPAAFEYADRELECLPRILSERGYTTHSYQTLNADFWNAARIERAMGFDHSYSENDFVQDEKIGMGLSDASKLRQMLGKLSALEEPYHALIYTTTSHSPYHLRGQAMLDVGEMANQIEGRYLQAVHYADAAVGEFIEELRERGILDRSLLIVFGDHHGLNRRTARLEYFFENPPTTEDGWFAEERRVPLLIRLPHGRGAGVRDDIGTQIDLPPTILALLGIEREASPMLGRDLLGEPPENPIALFSDGSAMARDRLWSMAAGGRCFIAGAEVDDDECADLRGLAERERLLSRAFTDTETLSWLRNEWDRRHHHRLGDLPRGESGSMRAADRPLDSRQGS